VDESREWLLELARQVGTGEVAAVSAGTAAYMAETLVRLELPKPDPGWHPKHYELEGLPAVDALTLAAFLVVLYALLADLRRRVDARLARMEPPAADEYASAEPSPESTAGAEADPGSP
jgi:hypothetical protein